MMEKVNIFLVDDHKLFREGLKLLLKNLNEVNEIWEAANGEEFLKELETQHPDLVLMDIEMPKLNGIQAAKLALWDAHDLKIIAVTGFHDQSYFMDLINAGCKGCISKDKVYEELETTINQVLKGELYFREDIEIE